MATKVLPVPGAPTRSTGSLRTRPARRYGSISSHPTTPNLERKSCFIEYLLLNDWINLHSEINIYYIYNLSRLKMKPTSTLILWCFILKLYRQPIHSVSNFPLTFSVFSVKILPCMCGLLMRRYGNS